MCGLGLDLTLLANLILSTFLHPIETFLLAERVTVYFFAFNPKKLKETIIINRRSYL